MTVSCIVCGRAHGDTWDRTVINMEATLEGMCLDCWLWAIGTMINYTWVQAMKASNKAMRKYDE